MMMKQELETLKVVPAARGHTGLGRRHGEDDI
jgi:hypothetical protein